MKNERKQRSKTEELGNANNEHDTNGQKAESEDAGSGALKSMRTKQTNDENEPKVRPSAELTNHPPAGGYDYRS